MKKVAIIAPSSLANVPFKEYYEEVLKEYNVPYDIYYWDRFHFDKDSSKGYRFSCSFPPIGFGSIFGYIAYRRFLLKHLNHKKYSLYIVLSVQMGILIREYLKDKKYIFDIRDFSHENNSVFKFLADNVAKSAALVAISSDGFRQWLPSNREYLLSHNVSLTSIKSKSPLPSFDRSRLIVSYIGAVGYYEANVKIINSIANNPQIYLRYIGSGISEKDLHAYCLNNKINNVGFIGRYLPAEKETFYDETDFVLACYGQKRLVERTLIPNRLYESCYLGRPIIVNSGTYMAEVVKKYGIGIVVDLNDLGGLYLKLLDYADAEIYQQYLLNCECFIEKVKVDIGIFQCSVRALLNDVVG
jgi:glycosyltransferase involved in cell wall biosynthesis